MSYMLFLPAIFLKKSV